MNSHIYHTPADRINNTVDQWAQWVPPGIPSGGAVYEVFVYVPSINATSWQAPYVISHADGTAQAVVDQYGLSNQWVSIGTYRMNPGNSVWTHDATGEAFGSHCGANLWCELGVDAVKFVRRGTAYAPDVRNSNGWVSQVTVRNNGSGLAKTLVKFLNAGGAVLCSNLPTLFANQAVTLACNNSQVASAVLDASQDMALMVSQERSTPLTLDAYAGVNQPTASVRVPIVQRKNNEIYSDLFIQNAGNINTNVTVQFLPAPGYGTITSLTWNNLVAGGVLIIKTMDLTGIGSGTYPNNVFVGSVYITNLLNQPLAVASTQYKEVTGNIFMMETSNSQSLATVLYAPLAQNNNNNIYSGLTLSQSGTGTFDARYYRGDNGSQCATQLGLTNNPQIIYPAPPTGNTCPTLTTAKFTASTNMSTNVNQSKAGGIATTYAALAAPSNTVTLAKVRRDSGWDDGFVVANFGSSTANIRVTYYNVDGTINTAPTFTLAANQHLIFYLANPPSPTDIPANFNGSVVVTADQPIAAIVNSGKAATGDRLGSYPGYNR